MRDRHDGFPIIEFEARVPSASTQPLEDTSRGSGRVWHWLDRIHADGTDSGVCPLSRMTSRCSPIDQPLERHYRGRALPTTRSTSSKPTTTVIERCILMTTDPGDLVLDPTCGSGTTAYVAEQWGRRWITIDTSRVAFALARQRLMGATLSRTTCSPTRPRAARRRASSRRKPLPPAATTATTSGTASSTSACSTSRLKSIANNPDIDEGMTREEIDAAIRRHAEFELLYDKPYEDKKKVRVAGPFTVESLSPHRSLGVRRQRVGEPARRRGRGRLTRRRRCRRSSRRSWPTCRRPGSRTAARSERIELRQRSSPTPAPTSRRSATREDAEEGTPKRIGITIGPQYGTVGPAFIKDAAREAIKAGDLDLLCVLGVRVRPAGARGTRRRVRRPSTEGFANVAAERRLGRIPVLLVRMNADL